MDLGKDLIFSVEEWVSANKTSLLMLPGVQLDD